jgi:very-short-patch-repair endonuclease
MGGRVDNRWRRAARVAARQHGVIPRQQLVQLGVSRREIDVRLADGRLTAIHRGVYLLGPAPLPHSHDMAAVLACAPASYLCRRTAGRRWALLPYLPEPSAVQVTVAGHNPGPRPGIELRRVRELAEFETTTWRRIPITTPTRTLLDLAGELGDGDLEQAIAEAFARNLSSHSRLRRLLDDRRGHPGSRRLRSHLSGPLARTRSRTERRLLNEIRRAGLPEPEVNAPVGRWEVDFLWRAQGVAVELDAYSTHASPSAFERDYLKASELEAAGLVLVRISSAQVHEQPEVSVERIVRRLAA